MAGDELSSRATWEPPQPEGLPRVYKLQTRYARVHPSVHVRMPPEIPHHVGLRVATRPRLRPRRGRGSGRTTWKRLHAAGGLDVLHSFIDVPLAERQQQVGEHLPTSFFDPSTFRRPAVPLTVRLGLEAQPFSVLLPGWIAEERRSLAVCRPGPRTLHWRACPGTSRRCRDDRASRGVGSGLVAIEDRSAERRALHGIAVAARGAVASGEDNSNLPEPGSPKRRHSE